MKSYREAARRRAGPLLFLQSVDIPKVLALAAISAASLQASGCYASYVAGSEQQIRQLRRFSRTVERYASRHGMPGVSYAVGLNGRIIWTESFGYADIESRREARPTTSYQMASLTKGFAATVAMKLVENGQLDLDDPLAKFDRALPNSENITVRHLMSMMTEESPGSVFRYNGARYDRLSAVIEAASGRRLAELIREWIVEPLELTATVPNIAAQSAFRVAGVDSATFATNVAQPYIVGESGPERAVQLIDFGAAVGMMSSAEDLVTFGMALDTDVILSGKMRREMFAPAHDHHGNPIPYALGWFSRKYFGERMIWNYGEWASASALLLKIPDRGYTFAIVANTDLLSEGYRLETGDLLRSPIAREFISEVLNLAR